MDPESAITIASAAAGVFTSKDVLGKILGPTADYLGDELLRWTQTRRNNVDKIFRNAEEKLGERINEPGRVPPKVLKEILDDGSFAEDELAAEYFGGVLASSRSGVRRDDRGAAIAKMVSQLTVYQLRSHFIFYCLFKHHYNGAGYSLTSGDEARKMNLYIPHDAYFRAMDIADEEEPNSLLVHSILGLARLNLIDDSYASNDADGLNKSWKDVPDAGIVVSPSPLGAELFLWAQGNGQAHVNLFLSDEIPIPSPLELELPDGVLPVKGRYEPD